MSDIEVDGQTLGVVPLLLKAISCYRETYEHFQASRKAARQLQIADAQFRVCRLNFLSECRLLLDIVVSDPHLSQEMVSNTQHSMWQHAYIAELMVRRLQDNAYTCATIIADATATVSGLDSRLIKLQILAVSHANVCNPILSL
jgi:hypothetical protein